MHSNSTAYPLRQVTAALLCLLALGVLGCRDAGPTAPGDSLSAADVPTALAVEAAGIVATIRGGAHYQLKDPPWFVGPFKWVYRFSFNVTKWGDETAAGTVRFLSHTPPGVNTVDFPGDWLGEVSIDCVEVDGNIAWMSGAVVRSRTDSPFGPSEGDVALFIVRDNGPEQADEINVGPVWAFGATDCHDTPPIGAGAFTDGNVIITSY